MRAQKLPTTLLLWLCAVLALAWSGAGSLRAAASAAPAAQLADATPDDDLPLTLFDREVAKLLLIMARRAKFQADTIPSPLMCVHKRNSEIINSLLGLPKVLNDAGRK